MSLTGAFGAALEFHDAVSEIVLCILFGLPASTAPLYALMRVLGTRQNLGSQMWNLERQEVEASCDSYSCDSFMMRCGHAL